VHWLTVQLALDRSHPASLDVLTGDRQF